MSTDTPSFIDQIAALQTQLDVLPLAIDLPGTWSARQVDAHEQKRAELAQRIRVACVASSTLRETQGQFDAETEWQKNLVLWREQLCTQLMDAPPRSSREVGLLQNLKLSILAIDRGSQVFQSSGYSIESSKLGECMRASGYAASPPLDEYQIFGVLPWFGSMAEVGDRLELLTRRRKEAQTQLTEALWDDATRARVANERALRAAKLNAMTKVEYREFIAREKAEAKAAEAATTV
jgi:hypothetical protein